MHRLKDYFTSLFYKKTTFMAGPKEFSLSNNITFFSTDYISKEVLDPLPAPMVIVSRTKEGSTLYHISSTHFHINLIHDHTLWFDHTSSNIENIILYPIKYIEGKTLEYLVSFKYIEHYDLIFKLSPFNVKTITVMYTKIN